MSVDRLCESRIAAALTTQVFGASLVVLESVGSTNDVAKDLAASGAPEGTVVLAEEQTAGRGRMKRRWTAPPASCLLSSILFRPALPLSRTNRLTMLCALAAADAIRAVAGLSVDLKWPNDLVVTSGEEKGPWRKLAGILTETGVVGEALSFAIVGIGINVNVSPGNLPALAPDATSLLAETGQPVNREELLVRLLEGVERRHGTLESGERLHREWASRLATLGRQVTVTTDQGLLTGLAESVDAGGALLLRTPDGQRHRLLAGDVTLAQPTNRGV